MAERSIAVRLRLIADEYERDAARVAKVTQQIGEAGEDAGKRSTSAFGKMVESARDNRQAWETTGRTLLMVGGAIAAIGVAALRTGIEYNTLQQTSRAALRTLLGDAEAANAQMDRLDEFARTSPFAKQVFIQAQQQMLGFGISVQRVIPYLDAAQNAVAAFGGSGQDLAEITYVMAQIQAASKITGVHLMQLGRHGIDAADLIGRGMGRTGAQIREDISDGALDAQTALDALAAGMQERFGGAAENVKNTYVGALDRVKAAWRDLSSELAEPLVGREGGGALVDLLNWAADMLRAFQALPEPVKAVVGGLTGLIMTATLLGGAFLTLIPKFVALKAHIATLSAQVPLLGTAFGAMRAAALPIAGVLVAGVTALGLFSNAQKQAKARSEELQATLDQTTAAITEQTRAWVLDRLEASGAASAARRLGLEMRDLVDASLNRAGDAARRLAAAFTEVEGSGISRRSQEWQDWAKLMREVGDQSGEVSDAQAALAEKIAATSTEADGAAGALAGMADGVQQVSEAAQAAEDALEDWRQATSSAVDQFADFTDAYQSVIDKNRELAEATAEATSSSKDSWEDFYDGVSVSVDDWIAELQRQVEAQRNWAQNIMTATNRVREELPATMWAAADEMIDALIQKGPEGAAQIEAFMTASPEEKAEIVALWRAQGIDVGNSFASGLDEARHPEIVLTVDASSAYSAVDSFIRDSSGRTIYVNVAGQQVGGSMGRGVQSFRAEGGRLPGAPSAVDNMVIAAASGEYVVNARATQRHLPLLEAINSGSVPGFQAGGFVAPLRPVPVCSAAPSVSRAGVTVEVTQYITTDDPVSAGLAGARYTQALVV